MSYTLNMEKIRRQRDRIIDNTVDVVLVVIGFSSYFLAIYIPFMAIGAFLGREFRLGVLYSLGALFAFTLAKDINK